MVVADGRARRDQASTTTANGKTSEARYLLRVVVLHARNGWEVEESEEILSPSSTRRTFVGARERVQNVNAFIGILSCIAYMQMCGVPVVHIAAVCNALWTRLGINLSPLLENLPLSLTIYPNANKSLGSSNTRPRHYISQGS